MLLLMPRQRKGSVERPWSDLVDIVRPHVVRIMTPRGSGTGFLLYNSKSKGISAIATAAHVVNEAHFWEEPIRVQHATSGKSTLVRAAERAILLDVKKDAAAIAFPSTDLELPADPLPLIPTDEYAGVGVEVGWLGFPAISTELCFFSGRVSHYNASLERYLIDGVAINGVSGGPAFADEEGRLLLMGALSAYIPNRATGEALPGLAVVADLVAFHAMVANFKSVEDAQAQQTQLTPKEEPKISEDGPKLGSMTRVE
jgi:hypothetical protein